MDVAEELIELIAEYHREQKCCTYLFEFKLL